MDVSGLCSDLVFPASLMPRLADASIFKAKPLVSAKNSASKVTFGVCSCPAFIRNSSESIRLNHEPIRHNCELNSQFLRILLGSFCRSESQTRRRHNPQ